ncbi:SRPBCC family protein [Niveibacterium sp. SC-1]|uniref:SRPBCC family protein n=1 Tax=Niveibacterium sp. SC-1 TaxID=3135646 RepID=UPI00311F1A2D
MTIIHTARRFAESPAEVFAAIRDPARLARWWGPQGFTNSFEVFEFQPGGRWVFVMHGPDGTDYPNESVFEEIVADALVRIRHVSQPHFVLSIGLAASREGTLLSWKQDFADPRVAEGIRHIVEPANEQNLDRLARELATGA